MNGKLSRGTTGMVVPVTVCGLLAGAAYVLAATGTAVRITVVDASGNPLPGATVEVIAEVGKPPPAYHIGKETWYIKDIAGDKLSLSIRDGRSGGAAELMIPPEAGTELSVLARVVGSTVQLEILGGAEGDKPSQADQAAPVARLGGTPPANDDCANAEPVGPLPATVIGDNTDATDDIGAPCGVFSGPFKNVWYSVVGTGGTLTASTCDAGTQISDTKISVFCADCDNLVCVDGNDDDCGLPGQGFLSTVSWCSEAGRTYYITVGGFSSFTAPGQFVLSVTDAGDSCTNPPNCAVQQCVPDFTVTAPGTWNGNTCGAGNDCALRGSEEHIYEVTLPNDGDWTFSLCGSSYDTYMFVGTTCCGFEVGSNDDSCGLQSEITVNLTAGTYYVMVEAFSSSGCGDYTLNISKAAACDVQCAGTKSDENEPNCGLPDDTINGGCNSTPPVFSAVACGEEYCGTAAWDPAQGVRDTDWYEITVTENTQFTWTVTPEFDALVGPVPTDPAGTGNCADVLGVVDPAAFPGPCETAVVVTDCLPPGTYWFFVAPLFDGGVACGAEYNARLDCQTCTIPVGACCLPDGTCQEGVTEAGCAGVWQGEGTDCGPPNPCPQPPPNDDCPNAIGPLPVPSTTAGTTVAATIDDTFPFCGTPITSPGVWYTVTGTGNTMTASTCNDADYDTKISVYCPDCPNAVCVVGADDFPGCAGFTTQVSWCSTAGETYLILVHGFGGATGNFNLTITDDGMSCPDPPACTICGPGAGDCCAANGTPGCEDETCCQAVCAIDPYCCDVEWDSICAGEAEDLCAVCAPVGACCVGLTCTIETQADCLAMNGDYLGDGTDCSGPGAGNPTVYEADPNVAIPDCDAGGISHTITVPDSFVIGDVNVDLEILHTWLGDLCVTVEHNNTSATLIARPGADLPCDATGCCGCSNDNYAGIILDDEGIGGAIEDQCSLNLSSPPNYTPDDPLGVFDGMDAAGDWTITVIDNACLDTGTLVHWSLHIDQPGPGPCVPTGACCVWPDTCDVITEDECNTAGGIYLGDDTDCGAGAVTVYTANPGMAIPDCDAGGVAHTINVPDSFIIQDADVDLSITHTWLGDLCVTVEHNNTSVSLIARPGADLPCDATGCCGCSNDNYAGIILDDEGVGGAIEDQCSLNLSSPPNYTPDNPLSAFDGMDAAGDWTITVIDNACLDTGTLDQWSLHLEGPAGASPCEGVFPGACCDGTTGICTDGVMEPDCVGDQTTWYKNMLCSEITCEQHTGACCDGTTGVCTDGVLPADCTGAQQEWFKDTPCSAIVCLQHTGACCDGTTGVCTDDVLPGDCTGPQQEWFKDTMCSMIVCVQHTGACCDGTTGICTDDVLPDDCVGGQLEWFKDTLCSAITCQQHTGACCDGTTGICTDDVLPGDCTGAQQEWFKDTPCSAIVCVQHTGACCDGTTGICTDDVLPGDCQGASQTWYKDTPCSAVVCISGEIPTASVWGLVVLTLLLLAGGKIYFGRRSAKAVE